MLGFLVESFLLGLKNLRLHKLRTFLTALGIICGVMAVIVMVSIGNGAKLEAERQMEQLGATNILVKSKAPPQSTEATGRTQRVLDYGLKRADLERLHTLPGLGTVVPLRNTDQRVTRGDIRVQANAIGTTPDIFRVINLQLARGRFLTDVDYTGEAAVCVIGAGAARDLFPFQDPLGERVQVGGIGMGSVNLTIVGVLEPVGLRVGSEGASMMERNLDQDIYFPLTLARSTFGDAVTKREAGSFERRTIELSEIWLQATDRREVERLASIAENLVRASHGSINDFEVKAPIQILRRAERLNRIFNFIIVGIASFTLIVGGIGIMNIMLATVTERTREIGIRRALGAKRRHITLQFLIETTVISLTGGLLGILLGAGLAKLVPIVAAYFGGNYPTSITNWSVFGSFTVAGLIGIIFGLYPAIMAARMNPIEALRHE